MPQDAPPNGSAREDVPEGPWSRVAGMQAKLHRWAAADPGRRFDDLFNFVFDPATLYVAFCRVEGNRGANTPGVDGMTVRLVEQRIGVREFLDDLRAQLKAGTFRPLPVRQRLIPKPGGSGKLRKLGIPAVADKVVQAALKLVLEVLDADIEAAFDNLSHCAVMDRVRARVKDKRVLALVKAFLKAGVLTESGYREDTWTGTAQGGILSPLIFNVALSVLDEHLHRPWKPGGAMAAHHQRVRRRAKGLPNWRACRYADDFVVLVDGTEADAEALREEIASVLASLGLRLSPAKTRIVHMSEGFDFLGFRIQWKRKRGTDKWYVYTFIADRAIRSLKGKIRALTRRTSQQDLGYVLARLNLVMHGWARFFRHAVAKKTFSMLDYYTWRRVARMLMERHHWRWKEFRRRHTTPQGHWLPITGGQTELRRIDAIPVTRYRYRGSKIPSPWPLPEHA